MASSTTATLLSLNSIKVRYVTAHACMFHHLGNSRFVVMYITVPCLASFCHVKLGTKIDYECSRQGYCNADLGKCECLQGYQSSSGDVYVPGERYVHTLHAAHALLYSTLLCSLASILHPPVHLHWCKVVLLTRSVVVQGGLFLLQSILHIGCCSECHHVVCTGFVHACLEEYM